MTRGLVSICIAVISILLFLPSLLFALDDFYDAPGIDPHRETLSSIPEEHIDPFTGGVTYTNTDARLPGNGGLDLVIQRTFSSKNTCNGPAGFTSCSVFGERTWMGYGWSLHFGRLFVKPASNGPHFIEMPDGSLHAAYLKAGGSWGGGCA